MKMNYLAERTFKTKYLEAFSPGMKKVTDEFRSKFPDCAYSIGWPGNLKITIISREDTLPLWEELIVKHDLPNNSNHK